jgi:hypothetical protein
MIKNDIRRVIQSGNGGLVISLPKDWCRVMGIHAGDAMKLVDLCPLKLRCSTRLLRVWPKSGKRTAT